MTLLLNMKYSKRFLVSEDLKQKLPELSMMSYKSIRCLRDKTMTPCGKNFLTQICTEDVLFSTYGALWEPKKVSAGWQYFVYSRIGNQDQ